MAKPTTLSDVENGGKPINANSLSMASSCEFEFCGAVVMSHFFRLEPSNFNFQHSSGCCILPHPWMHTMSRSICGVLSRGFGRRGATRNVLRLDSTDYRFGEGLHFQFLHSHPSKMSFIADNWRHGWLLIDTTSLCTCTRDTDPKRFESVLETRMHLVCHERSVTPCSGFCDIVTQFCDSRDPCR